MYRVSGRTVASAAVANAVANLWNPHANQAVKLREFSLVANVAPAAGAAIALRRTTTRGTAGSTVTPDIDNDTRRRLAPPSGLLLDLAAFSAQPTMDASELDRWTLAAVAASGFRFPVDIEIPPGTGLAIVGVTVIVASDVGFTWLEDW